MGFAILLASTSLLRILKSNTASHGLETTRARAALFAAINMAKQMTVDSADMAAKTVTILNSVWNSSRAFRKADGGEYTALRIRSRLVLSPIIDTVWWWRDEFDPPRTMRSVITPSDGKVFMCSRYNVATDAGAGATVDANRDFAGGMVPSSGMPDQNNAFHLDEQFLADFEWALGDDALFSLDPLPANWAPASNLL